MITTGLLAAMTLTAPTAHANQWGYYVDSGSLSSISEWLLMIEMYVEGTSGLSESAYYTWDTSFFDITFNPVPDLLVFYTGTPADSAGLAAHLKTFVDSGHDVLIVQPVISSGTLPEPFASYIPFAPAAGTVGGPRVLSTIDGEAPGTPGGHTMLQGGPRFDYYGAVNNVTVRPGATLISSFTGGAAAGVPAMAEWRPSGAGKVLALNFLPVSIYVDHQQGYDPRNGSDAFVGGSLAYLTGLPPYPLTPHMQVWGTCGSNSFAGGRGYTPYGEIIGLLDDTPEWDLYIEDVGACTGLELEFTGWRQKGPFYADAYGAVGFRTRLPSCFKAFMSVDMETCTTAESVYVEP